MREVIEIIPCHRIPERYLYINGTPMPICTRCFAMLLGYLFLPIAVVTSMTIPLWIPLLMAVPLLIDGFTQRWKWRTSNNPVRFLTGLLFGVGQSLLILTVVWHMVSIIK